MSHRIWKFKRLYDDLIMNWTNYAAFDFCFFSSIALRICGELYFFQTLILYPLGGFLRRAPATIPFLDSLGVAAIVYVQRQDTLGKLEGCGGGSRLSVWTRTRPGLVSIGREMRRNAVRGSVGVSITAFSH